MTEMPNQLTTINHKTKNNDPPKIKRIKCQSSNDNEEVVPKKSTKKPPKRPARLRNKGRKAFFMVDQLMRDQCVTEPQQYPRIDPVPKIIPPLNRNIGLAASNSVDIIHYNRETWRPDLLTADSEHIPEEFDLLPRNNDV